MSNYTCDRCAGPRSRWSKELCLACYSHRLVPDCTHHWVFAPPRGGRYSLGRGKLCGERRKGVNSISNEYSMPVGKAVMREPGGEEVKAWRLKYYANAKQKVMR